MHAAVAVVALICGACSSTPVNLAGGNNPTNTPGAPGTQTPTKPAGSQRAGANPRAGTSSPPSSSGSAKPSAFPSGPASTNDFRLVVTLNRSCARRGDDMVAKASTIPDVDVSFATAYQDNSMLPDYYYVPKDGNPTGEVTWRWVLRPTTAYGESELLVVAGASGKGGASYTVPFTVAEQCP